MAAVTHAGAELGAPRGLLIASITNAIVRLHARAYGKGPTRASTHLRSGDYVLCVLRDPFTVAERTLIAAGEDSAVVQNRKVFYRVAERSLRDAVERLTGYTVAAFTAGVSVENDLVTHLFVLGGRNESVDPPRGAVE
ncbi:MAG: hypothetical protein QOE69_531 [Thermoleophilaceae bacterium]|nr:hypothetical protein [Thermoleophilaceae bacterium]